MTENYKKLVCENCRRILGEADGDAQGKLRFVCKRCKAVSILEVAPRRAPRLIAYTPPPIAVAG